MHTTIKTSSAGTTLFSIIDSSLFSESSRVRDEQIDELINRERLDVRKALRGLEDLFLSGLVEVGLLVEEMEGKDVRSPRG
jgi:hypothetical protein